MKKPANKVTEKGVRSPSEESSGIFASLIGRVHDSISKVFSGSPESAPESEWVDVDTSDIDLSEAVYHPEKARPANSNDHEWDEITQVSPKFDPVNEKKPSISIKNVGEEKAS